MARKDFHHPLEPYDIQQDLMEAIYECIEDGRVGIFESPTGTGKSLSLICASLTWLREHKRRQYQTALDSIHLDHDEPEWMLEHARDQRRKDIVQMRAELEARLEAIRQREQRTLQRSARGEPPPKRRKQANADAVQEADDYFALDDYESDDEKQGPRQGGMQYSAETTSMMQDLGLLRDEQQAKSGSEGAEEELKIFFSSRTHSQLSQFIGELARVRLPAGLPPETEDDHATEDVRHLTLGSRKNLCINPKVLKLTNATAINERCVELQQAGASAEHKCPYLPTKDSEDTILDFRDHVLARVRDIEDLAVLGAKLDVCPYYASRPAIAPAEIVTLPYPLLLQASARESLGISLKGHIVVIDEAHNLIDAVQGTHSVQITGRQLSRARLCLMTYLQKFRNRLKGSNRTYITQLVRVIDSLLAFTHTLKDVSDASGTVAPAMLLSGKGADQVNMTKLVRYIGDSKLARKVDGYHQHVEMSKAQASNGTEAATAPEVPTLTLVANFLVPLMNPSHEGKFFWHWESDVVSLQYMLLDPSEHFKDVVENARAVVMAGGTMSPMDDYRKQLLPYVNDLRTHSCGHLIPPSSLLVQPIAADQDGPLDFSFKARSDAHTPGRIGRALASLVPKVRGGVVVFVPSYTWLEEILAAWRKQNIYDRVNTLKPIFIDSRSGATSAEDTFKAYSAAIHSNPGRGAILLSVIGGKLSEGINFADDLGRCVLVVGLPFPNLNTPEWKAKLEYIEAKAVARGEVSGRAGREHAENVCMRAVNQAIGRVIRHKGDWASILLMDSRYAQERIRGKLPGWIRESLPNVVNGKDMEVGRVTEDVGRFFETRAAAH